MAFEGCGRRRGYTSCRARQSQRGEGGDAEGGQKDPRRERENIIKRKKGQKQERIERIKNSVDIQRK